VVWFTKQFLRLVSSHTQEAHCRPNTLTIWCPVRVFSEDPRFTASVNAVVFIGCTRLHMRIHTLRRLRLHRRHRFTRTVLTIILTIV